jgi:hypothetical protein
MRISQIVLALGSLIYLGFGFLFFINPDAITDLDGVVLPTRGSANHIRAVFGGMEIGLGFLLIYFLMRKERILYGLIVLSLSIGTTSVARLYGIILDDAGDMTNWIGFIPEFIFGSLALYLFVKEKKRRDSGLDNLGFGN